MKILRLLVVALCGALVLAACSGKDAVNNTSDSQFHYVGTTPHGKTIAVADRRVVGNATGTLMDGGTFDLAADKGKVVVLNFWASWCPPCRSESPGLDSVYRANKAKGVDFVGLDVMETSRDSATSFLKLHKISYPIVWDPNAKTALQLGKVPLSIGLPWTVVIDKDQRVAAVYTGIVLPADLQPVLTQLTAES